jgi:acyl-CoA thioesterase YciA
MMPRETNAHGTIFGGIILSYIDQAGAVGAIEAGCKRVVTVAMNKVEFHQPVFVGDLVSLYTNVEKQGSSSIVVHVDVRARRQRGPGDEVRVTEATVTYVNIDDAGRPVPIQG